MDTAEALAIELPGGARLEWDLAVLRAGKVESAWRLGATVDWTGVDCLRILTVAAGESAVALAALRPSGAEGHDAETVAAGYLHSDDNVQIAGEALLSTEYDPTGAARRVGVELWAGSGMPLRIAADRTGEATHSDADGIRRETTPLSARFDGAEGPGLFEVLRPA
jgi:hypothetical protein